MSPDMVFSYGEGAREKLEALRLGRESVEEMILACESERRVILSEGTARRFCHRALGCATLWAEYEPAEDGYRVESVYCHRLTIEE